ncbi:MAG: cytochrome b family protein [Thermoplasmatota archaeon]
MRPIEGHPFWPHEVVRDAIVFFVFTGMCFYLSAFLPYFLELPAGPTQPPVILPDWYLLWAYGALKITQDVTILGRPVPIPGIDADGNVALNPLDWGPINAKLFGLIMNAIPGIPFLVVPFLDRGDSRRPVESPFWASLGLATVIYVLMLSVYSVDTVVDPKFPQFGKEYSLWTLFHFAYTHGAGPIFDWMYRHDIILTDPAKKLDLSSFTTLFKLDLLSWLCSLIPILTFFVTYVPLKIMQKKHGYEAKLNYSYYDTR